MNKEIENLMKIDSIIAYLEKTTEESWCMDVCRTTDGRNCLLGHLFDYGGGDDGHGSAVVNIFEEVWATSFMFYPINDGEHPDYQQPTPKQRCIAYIKDLKSGKQKRTLDLLEEQEKMMS